MWCLSRARGPRTPTAGTYLGTFGHWKDEWMRPDVSCGSKFGIMNMVNASA